jgi:hypothetical protein
VFNSFGSKGELREFRKSVKEYSNELVKTKKDKISRRLLRGIFNTELYDEEEAPIKEE